jgi:thioredoxin-dependent peroxiredoxin
MNITFQGNLIQLKGKPLQIGDKLSDFTLRKNDLSDFTANDLSGVTVFITVPSLDTPVCDLEIKRFHKDLSKLGKVKVYAVSVDLPFAQQRWCGANGVDGIETLSDYAYHNFGEATGTLIQPLELLTRAVIILGSDRSVAYVQYVPEVTNHPDYEAVYQAISSIQ